MLVVIRLLKETKQQIGGVKEAFGDITFNLKSSVNGRVLNLSKKEQQVHLLREFQ